MSQSPPDRYGFSDEQAFEFEQATNDLGFDHRILADDPRHRDSLDERLRREARERSRTPRDSGRFIAPDQGFGPYDTDQAYATDAGVDDGDLSAEERAMRVDPRY
ncbi:DUF5709 domain-containing protein [Planomonospora corallina]|uniref:DUF5709 domain-containing protein n=1 Tax=Planomonospora corallina TaxID=1806052 RepID=A0ABV8IFG0_9ACTN